MKVVDKTQNLEELIFADLNHGDVFKIHSSDSSPQSELDAIYMKIMVITGRSSCKSSALVLTKNDIFSQWQTISLKETTRVIPVPSTLIIGE